ncbi:hypothetical protein KZ829_33820 [Actinoplanes hulinensis]|uniref:Uncharacterized protein n=1 Tax=Actinoplanes hulinensis TaxID=1144547 RepID=A0ABS7BCF3_9ACTN|nr:hypothetical protein [Actinoplanes hulinensis]MBW6438718.1 hypothetical protein [Actinoplanes hulinensis]
MPGFREIQQQEAEQIAAGWKSMVGMIEHLSAGRPVQPVQPTIMCRPGEEQYGTLPVDVSLYCGADYSYSGGTFASGGLLFTAAAMAAGAAYHANQRRKAEEASRPQWRPWGRFPAIVTNRRVLLMIEQWSSYELEHLLMIEPSPMQYSVALHFEGSYPIMLRGPWVPWATVTLCGAMFGKPWPPGFVPPPELQGIGGPAPQTPQQELPPGL